LFTIISLLIFEEKIILKGTKLLLFLNIFNNRSVIK